MVRLLLIFWLKRAQGKDSIVQHFWKTLLPYWGYWMHKTGTRESAAKSSKWDFSDRARETWGAWTTPEMKLLIAGGTGTDPQVGVGPEWHPVASGWHYVSAAAKEGTKQTVTLSHASLLFNSDTTIYCLQLWIPPFHTHCTCPFARWDRKQTFGDEKEHWCLLSCSSNCRKSVVLLKVPDH